MGGGNSARKERWSPNSFGQVKNEKGLVGMHKSQPFVTTRIVVVNHEK